MPARKLSYQVDVDSSDAVRDLRRLGDAGRDAGDDLKAGFDDAESAATKALRAISQEADRMESELKGTGDAVKAIGANLGDGFDSSKIERMVGDLRRMGVSFEEIEANAKEFADVVQRVDGIKLDAVNRGLTDVDSSLDRVRDSGDQSRSVLANLAGNAAQDLGELGGVVGTLGVGIGQLAEYAVDGNIALSNLAKVVGPMALVATAITAATSVIGGFRERAKAAEEEIQRLTDIMKQGGDATSAYADMLAEVGLIATDAAPGLVDVGKEILGIDDTTRDLIDTLDQAGIGLYQWGKGVAGGVEDAQELQRAIDDAVESGRISEDQWRDLTAALAEGGEKWEKAAADVDQANRLMRLSTESINEVLDEQAAKLQTQDTLWAAVINDLRDGTLDTANATDAYNQLQRELGLGNDEMAEMANQKLDEKLQADADAAQELHEQLQETNNSLLQAALQFDAAAARGEAFASSLDEINRAIPGLARVSQAQTMSDFAEGIDGVVSALDELPGAISDLPDQLVPDDWADALDITEQQQALLDALSGMAGQIQTEMGKAFEEGGAAGVRAWAADATTAIEDQLRAAGVTSQEEINKILGYLGLLPDQVTTAINISGDALARQRIDTILGAVGDIPTDVVLQVTAQMAEDPTAALQYLIDYLESTGVQIPAELDTTQLDADIAGVEGQETGPVGFAAELDTDDAKRDAQNFTDAKRETTVDVDIATLVAAALLTTFISQPRTATITAEANVAFANFLLDLVARPRTARITAEARTAQAEFDLNWTARDRTSRVFQRVVPVGGGRVSSGSAVPQAAPVGVATTAEPMAAGFAGSGVAVLAAPTPVVNNFHVELKAGVIGDPHTARRWVTGALQQSARLGSRR